MVSQSPASVLQLHFEKEDPGMQKTNTVDYSVVRLSRWPQLKTVTADLSVTGALWQIKGQAGALQQFRIEAELHRQKVMTLPQTVHLGFRHRRDQKWDAGPLSSVPDARLFATNCAIRSKAAGS